MVFDEYVNIFSFFRFKRFDPKQCDNRYVAVGNEPFLSSYSGQFQSYVIPALTNLQQSLAKANLAGFTKLVVPCNADAYEASLPSHVAF